MHQGIIAGMTARGFVLEETGGGCDAFIRNGEEGEEGSVWVTAHCDPSAPTQLDEPIDVGFYIGDSLGGDPILRLYFPSVLAFFEATQSQADNLAYKTEKYGKE
jgi:hypothetical protein